MQLNGSLDFLQKKLCSVKSTRSFSSLVAAAESRLQELNQLSAEIMDTGSPEQTRFVTATATDIAVRLLQLQSDINDNDSLTQYNAQLIHDFERRNTKSDNAHATWPHHQLQTIIEQKQAIHFQTIGEQKQANTYNFTTQTADTATYIIVQDILNLIWARQ